MTEDEYKLRREQYSENDKKAWIEDGKSEQEIREFIEYEETLTYEEKDKAREERQSAREEEESKMMSNEEWEKKYPPDSKKSEKELLIDIKDFLFDSWKMLAHLPDIRTQLENLQEVIAALKFIMLFLGIIGLVLIYIAFKI